MTKNWTIAATAIMASVSLVVALISGGIILGIAIEKKPNTTENNPVNNPQNLIVGKWTYWATNADTDQWKGSVATRWMGDPLTVEYFEDGTYIDVLEGNPGTYVMLSDGRLKRTYTSCRSLPCKEIVYAYKISFPDVNTLWVGYTQAGAIYKRVSP